MKKILSVALAVVLFAGASQAQTTEEKGHRHGQQKEQAFDNLNLTAEQKAKFQSLREAQKKEAEGLRKSGEITPEQRKVLHEKYRSQYEAILTPAQWEQFKKQKEEWKQKGAGGKSLGRRGELGKQGAFFKKELNLTSDQETKLKSIFQEFHTKSKDIRTNTSLSKEQKRSQMQALAQQYMAQGKALLTPEQAKKFDELKGRRWNRKNSNV